MLHHAHSDDPALDPHPPLDKGYWAFLVEMRHTVRSVFARHYVQLWGDSADSRLLLRRLSLLMRVATFLKVLVWFLLLGPELFSFLFAFAVPFKMCHYAWFNYVTHRPCGVDTIVVNRNEHVYKLINAIAFGLYFHGNHHIRPALFDPRRYREKNAPGLQMSACVAGRLPVECWQHTTVVEC
jgi:fatty-acid desaturase